MLGVTPRPAGRAQATRHGGRRRGRGLVAPARGCVAAFGLAVGYDAMFATPLAAGPVRPCPALALGGAAAAAAPALKLGPCRRRRVSWPWGRTPFLREPTARAAASRSEARGRARLRIGDRGPADRSRRPYERGLERPACRAPNLFAGVSTCSTAGRSGSGGRTGSSLRSGSPRRSASTPSRETSTRPGGGGSSRASAPSSSRRRARSSARSSP